MNCKHLPKIPSLHSVLKSFLSTPLQVYLHLFCQLFFASTLPYYSSPLPAPLSAVFSPTLECKAIRSDGFNGTGLKVCGILGDLSRYQLYLIKRRSGRVDHPFPICSWEKHGERNEKQEACARLDLPSSPRGVLSFVDFPRQRGDNKPSTETSNRQLRRKRNPGRRSTRQRGMAGLRVAR